MDELGIQVEALSKRYRIGAPPRPRSLRGLVASPFRYLMTTLTPPTEREVLWALRDVSFAVPRGQVLGVIGRNGAGKSTLLKILSRITEPTAGRARVFGRIGSLLEVGTGFHPELTGRENVFLNGAILGMRRREIESKFDEIVAFAGIERFVDTPVKRYSSGMYVRLGFSVAAYLEPDILLIDEVLAVGDAEFQRRSLGKMEDIGRSGRTVLFVSHNMATITRLCERAILLDGGQLVADGPAEAVVSEYLHAHHGVSATREWVEAESPGNDLVRLRAVRVVDEELASAATVDVRSPVGIEIVFEVLGPGDRFVPWIALYNDQGAHVFSAMDTDPAWREPRTRGRYVSRAWIPENLLNEGTIVVSISLNTFAAGRAIRQAHVDEAVAFQVIDTAEGDTARGDYAGAWPGPVRPLLRWTTDLVSARKQASATRS